MLDHLLAESSTANYCKNGPPSGAHEGYMVAVILQGSTEIPLLVKSIYSEKSSTEPKLKTWHNFEKKLKSWTLDEFKQEETELSDPTNFIKKEAKNHLDKIYSYDESLDSKALNYMFDLIEGSLYKHDLFLVDALLSNIDLVRTRKIVFIGLLRGTFRARSNLNNWNSCAIKINRFLHSNGEDSKRLLRGLKQPNDSFTLTSTTIS